MARIPDKMDTKTKRKEPKLCGSGKGYFQDQSYCIRCSFDLPKNRASAVLKHAAPSARKVTIAKVICTHQGIGHHKSDLQKGEALTPKKNYRRGYAVAVLIGFGANTVTLWNVFSKVVKPSSTLHTESNETNSKALYNLHEQIVNALRPAFKEGLRSVILVSPPKTNYAKDFRDHVEKHQSWLLNGPTRIAFAELTGSANSSTQVATLARNPVFQKTILETTTEETTNLLELLEARLNTSGPKVTALYSIQEAENLILNSRRDTNAERLLLTDKYFAQHREKGRLNRLLQVAANKKVETRIIKAESPAGKRLAQLGGFVCLRKPDQN